MKTTYLCGSPWLPDAVPVLGRDHGAERAQPLCPHCPACQATSLEVPSAATVSPEATSLVLQVGDGGEEEETSTMAKWEGEERGRGGSQMWVAVRGREAQEEKGREGEAARRRLGRMEVQGQVNE